MNDWSLASSSKPALTRKVAWTWWTLDAMRRTVEITEANDSNFRSISVWRSYLAFKELGQWGPSPQSICLNSKGHLLDGLNRFKSDLAAGITGRWYLTVCDWPDEDDAGIDRAKARNAAQWFRRHVGEGLGNQEIATMGWSLRGASPIDISLTPRLSPELLSEIYEDHKDAFERVFSAPKRRGFYSPIRAAFVRAHYHIPADDLDVALEIVSTGERPDGMSKDKASPLMMLNRVLSGPKLAGTVADRANYSKAASALLAWGRGKSLSKLYGFEKDPFPVKSLDSTWKRLVDATTEARKSAWARP
jgi:hypothetical protein